MLYIPYKVGEIIGTCTKCASTSIANEFLPPQLNKLTSIAVVELKKSGWSVTGVIRDPIDRLESAYNFFQYGQQGIFPNGKRYESITHFVDSVLSGDADEHWLPQAGQLVLCTDFITLESFQISRTENSSEHIEKIANRSSELVEYYMADIALRGG